MSDKYRTNILHKEGKLIEEPNKKQSNQENLDIQRK
jgi:hypothetical protein